MPGQTPYDSAESYARGEISRDDLIHLLTTWRYLPSETRTTGLHDDLLNTVSGSFDDVEAAITDGLIDDKIYTRAHEAFLTQMRERG